MKKKIVRYYHKRLISQWTHFPVLVINTGFCAPGYSNKSGLCISDEDLFDKDRKKKKKKKENCSKQILEFFSVFLISSVIERFFFTILPV